MNRLVGKRPEHEAIYIQVKELILFGEVVPGQPLTIHGLADMIGAGITPVREAMRRLTAEGALAARENRRVEVPVMTPDRLAQIDLVRLTVEPKLALMAASRGAAAVMPDMERLDARVDQAIKGGDIRGYLEANFRFHFTLYDAAEAPILRRIAESLWLQAGPSLRVVCGRYGTSNLKDLHQQAIAALRSGAPQDVADAIEGDIRQGMDFVRQTLTD
ncbi:GntR family transcriptional regulator [Ruegeria sp. 2205SS24-7]|uniref:GntR family transcriptional regulator n=1 Tax=Ruegeria discodermiae TaxID=3064389 RepID=UPI0027406884|nr:GntR family transcriptional regulator [Ruegeria sp. 2205SS24-7]MDP5218090.1 GntR family transcriptional regulator [Ruegeria sp. 2205SS24-7]